MLPAISENTKPMRPFGINIIGHVSSNVSLSVIARQFIRYFLDHKVPVATYDIDYGRAEGGRSSEFSELTVSSPTDLPYAMNLFFVALWEIPAMILWPRAGVFSKDRVNAAVFWTEPAYLQPRYREALGLLDILIAGSDYVRNIFATQVSSTPVIYHKQPIYIPEDIRASREAFNLPNDRTLFVQSFDPHNDLERKNPYAAISAFQHAFPSGDEPAGLVLKLNNVELKSDLIDPDKVVEDLRSRCNGDARVFIVARSLPYIEALRLYASCDAFISLHRAEGLGLGMLECMALGKPVIATAWSGNMSFMRHDNACLVGYDLIPFSGLESKGRDGLGKRCTWADPHVEEAADWMRALTNDPVLRQKIGARAREAYNAYQSEATSSALVDELRALWSERSFMRHAEGAKWKNTARLLKEYERYHFSAARRLTTRAGRIYARTIGWRFEGAK